MTSIKLIKAMIRDLESDISKLPKSEKDHIRSLRDTRRALKADLKAATKK
jgi:hypothetical protein